MTPWVSEECVGELSASHDIRQTATIEPSLILSQITARVTFVTRRLLASPLLETRSAPTVVIRGPAIFHGII